MHHLVRNVFGNRQKYEEKISTSTVLLLCTHIDVLQNPYSPAHVIYIDEYSCWLLLAVAFLECLIEMVIGNKNGISVC